MKKLWLASIILVWFAITSFAEKNDVTITADDGFALKGTLYTPGKVGPGILLLHQCNADRQIYDHLATMLSTAGYNTLTLDFRGFGGSKSGEYADFASQRQKIQEKWPADVELRCESSDPCRPASSGSQNARVAFRRDRRRGGGIHQELGQGSNLWRCQ